MKVKSSGQNAASGFVERFAGALAQMGFPRLAARVFAAILVDEEGKRTAAQLSTQLHMSPAAISGAVRYLVETGLITRERAPGQRHDLYRFYDSNWYETIMRRDRIYNQCDRTLREGIELVGSGSQAGTRLDETRRFFEFIHNEMTDIRDKWKRVEQTQHLPVTRGAKRNGKARIAA